MSGYYFYQGWWKRPFRWTLSRLADLIPTERPWVWFPERWFDQCD